MHYIKRCIFSLGYGRARPPGMEDLVLKGEILWVETRAVAAAAVVVAAAAAKSRVSNLLKKISGVSF